MPAKARGARPADEPREHGRRVPKPDMTEEEAHRLHSARREAAHAANTAALADADRQHEADMAEVRRLAQVPTTPPEE